MLIREIAREDIDQVYDIECENFSQPWSRESLLAELEGEKSHYLVALDEDTIIGYIGFWKIFDEGHITNVAVRKLYQGQGVGSMLVKSMLSVGYGLGIDSYTLEVRISNDSAIALYKKYGFVDSGIRKGFYDQPKEDAIIMWLRMNNEEL